MNSETSDDAKPCRGGNAGHDGYRNVENCNTYNIHVYNVSHMMESLSLPRG